MRNRTSNRVRAPFSGPFEEDWPHNGWSVLEVSADGRNKTAKRPHATRLGASIECVFGQREFVGGTRTVVNHDEEMRRWDYLMALREPTPEERAQLPIWHENYETIPPRSPEQRAADEHLVAYFFDYNEAHSAATHMVLTLDQFQRESAGGCEHGLVRRAIEA